MAVSSERVTAHRLVSEALEAGVRNRDWFLWVDVSGDPVEEEGLARLVTATEEWLARRDPDAAQDAAPELQWVGAGVRVLLRALPKKPHARGAAPLVGNPYPTFTSWTVR